MGLKGKVIHFFDVPMDVLGDLPRITWIGDAQLTIQGRHRLISCQEEQIILATLCGRLTVCGEGLYLASVARGETQLCGKITQIGYFASGK